MTKKTKVQKRREANIIAHWEAAREAIDALQAVIEDDGADIETERNETHDALDAMLAACGIDR